MRNLSAADTVKLINTHALQNSKKLNHLLKTIKEGHKNPIVQLHVGTPVIK